MRSPLLSPGSSSEDETISVVAHQGSTQSLSSRSSNTRPAWRSASARNSWRSSPSSSDNSYRGLEASTDRRSGNGGDTAPESTPGGLGANSFRSSSLDSNASRKSREHPATSVASKVAQPLPLYGNALLSIPSIGSGEDEASVTWSDTLGADDTADDYSIRDPHFDLTTAKMAKLFSLSSPDGASCHAP
jgi:hypothetical protein